MITAKLILTGKETYDLEGYTVSKHDALEAMIEFAKLHVEACKKEIAENATTGFDSAWNANVDKDSILNAYPLENIK